MIPLAPPLLELARSIAPDEGTLVVRNLRGILRQVCHFDAAELALLGVDGFRRRDEPGAGPIGAPSPTALLRPQSPDGLRRWPLEPGAPALGSAELVAHVAGLGAPLRLDDLGRGAPAGGHLLQPGYRSLLALPLASAGGPAGALLLVRRYAWAFVAAPLADVQVIAGMAGLCLERSLWLSALAQHGRDLHAGTASHGASALPGPAPRPDAAAGDLSAADAARPAPAPGTEESHPGGDAARPAEAAEAAPPLPEPEAARTEPEATDTVASSARAAEPLSPHHPRAPRRERRRRGSRVDDRSR